MSLEVIDVIYESELRRYDKWFKDKEGFNGIDYEKKSLTIKQKVNNMVNELGHHIYCRNLFDTFGIYNANELNKKEIHIFYNSLADNFGFRSIIEGIRINNARYHRVGRLRKRIESIINTTNNSFFLTLTFTNESLEKLSEKTRRRYVHYYLKSISNNYVANIDYGKRNHREHYHAVVQCDFIDYKLWKYGSLDFEYINIFDDSCSDRLSKYVAKLCNHAIKETTKRNHLIYSKTS